ncbi:MAG TPA: HAMP domain-containing sensor histidine kinase [Iamia sp.]
MSLRSRLLLVTAGIVGIMAVGAVLLLRTQEAFLIDQVDAQLEASRPFIRPISDSAGFDVPPRTGRDGETPPDTSPDAPISRLFVGTVVDGELVPVLAGRLLDDAPAVDVDPDALARVVDGDPFTVDGTASDQRFRTLAIQPEGGSDVVIVALPLDEVDSAMSRLFIALGGGLVLVSAVLLLAVWWVERLGLRPIARLTATADAVSRGERRHRATVTRPRTEAGRLAHAFNVMLDERDATEERLRQFVADASHELRTPLTSVRGYLDLYREGGFRQEGELDDVVRRMSHEASRMYDLIEDLLLLANLDQHRPLRREPVDVEDLLGDAARDARAVQPRRRIEVQIKGTVSGLVVTGDRYRLQQVVAALLANALAYTDGAIWLAAITRTAGVTITVADEGPGLEPADAARAFDRFFRAEPSRARRTGGSGLGLTIARSIVEAHGGSIVLHTASGHGCCFVVELPLVPPDDALRSGFEGVSQTP